MIGTCYAPDLNCRPTLIKDLGTIVKMERALPSPPSCALLPNSSPGLFLNRSFKMAYRHVVRNPRLQARIFLCNWYMKVVRPGKEQPDNVVQLHVPME